jgi:aspartokinase/homoserine dehydrogenase 1
MLLILKRFWLKPKKKSRLKFVAQFENAKASVYNSSQRPSFYNLEGKDNIVLFFTDRYVDQPLLIKGLVPG